VSLLQREGRGEERQGADESCLFRSREGRGFVDIGTCFWIASPLSPARGGEKKGKGPTNLVSFAPARGGEIKETTDIDDKIR
jgi:hypothetical protein